MTVEDFVKLLIYKGTRNITVDVYSPVTGNVEQDKTAKKTVVFSDDKGNEITRIEITP